MKFRNTRRQWLLLTMSVGLFANCSARAGEEREAGGAQFYSIDVALLSFLPGEGLEACRSYGGGAASGNATVGHWVKDGNRNFGVTVECIMTSHRFWATVRIEPSESDESTEARVHELDLSGFEPQAIDMAKDGDGRVYRLNLMPSVQIAAAPKRFRSQDLRLEDWSFPNCPIILNDERYLGRISCSHGELAWLDIPGTALVEFSLIRFADAQPWGVLHDGVVDISNPDGTSLNIGEVANGIPREVLKGGPYQVWVRWKKPTHSLKEHQELVKQQVANIRNQINAGDLKSPATVELLEKMAGSEGIWLMSNGVRALRPEEKVSD
jgi:hypothetical protein